MKLNHLIIMKPGNEVIRQFGRAQLVRLPDRRHELIGGDEADRQAAVEWVSLFAHDIVFTRQCREAAGLNAASNEDERKYAQRLQASCRRLLARTKSTISSRCVRFAAMGNN